MRYLPISHAHVGSIAGGNLESAVQEAMVRHLGRGEVFYDIGANLGFFSLLAAHLSGLHEGRVYAFEAAPDNAEAVRRNAELNLIPNVVVIAKAVAARAGRGRLQVVDDQSWSKLAEYGDHPYTERVIDVELVAIDDLVRGGELAPPALVKIDVEGAEIAVLEGMRETIERHRPAIICELHDTHVEFVAAMRGHDYRVINAGRFGHVMRLSDRMRRLDAARPIPRTGADPWRGPPMPAPPAATAVCSRRRCRSGQSAAWCTRSAPAQPDSPGTA
jgi:FkbM family methyltransferase